MIKNIFIPESFGDYYIFKEHLLAFSIDKTQVNAIVLLCSGKTRVVTHSFEEIIDCSQGAQVCHETIVAAINKIITSVPFYTKIIMVTGSTGIFCKELQIPLKDTDKIRLVLAYELEPLLPLSIADAVIDFSITAYNPTSKVSTIMAIALPKSVVAGLVEPLSAAKLSPSSVTIDAVEIYTLLARFDQVVFEADKAYVLLDIHMQQVSMSLVVNGQLKTIRAIPGGIQLLVKQISQDSGASASHVLDTLMRYGLQGDAHHSESLVKKSLDAFFKDILFTINAFKQQFFITNIEKVFLFESNIKIAYMRDHVQERLSCESVLIDALFLLQHHLVSIPAAIKLHQGAFAPLAAACNYSRDKRFNLLQDSSVSVYGSLFFKQLIAAGLVTIVSLLLFVAYGMYQLHGARERITESETEIVSRLQAQLPELQKSADQSVDIMVMDAERIVRQQEATWFAFSEHTRISFLKYLLELTNKIDKEALGFKIFGLSIKGNTMLLRAQVRDHDALKVLEKELRQIPYFEHVETQSDTTFSMKITLNTKKKR